MYKETKRTVNKVLVKKAYEETFAPKSSSKKAKQRFDIDEKVFDLNDSVADNAKWLSTLTTLLSRIYDILPEEQKSLLDPTDREVIEYMFYEFANTYTRADIQFQEEGFNNVILKIMERQREIGNIVK